MKENEIPYMTDVAVGETANATFPIRNLIDEIADEVNISESFKYVIDHLECAEQRENMRPKKAEYCKRLLEQLKTGDFVITPDDIREMEVEDGPKKRIVQCPYVYHRVGCHAVMVPVERRLYPTLITNTAASIKGRGMHWLHQIVEDDLLADPDNTLFFYQCDIHGFYDHIIQDNMKKQMREYISDHLVLKMLDNFITLMPRGLSKGLRSSQCLANLHLNAIDHKMCEVVEYHEIISPHGATEEDKVIVKGDGNVTLNNVEIRFHYYRYCDDIVFIGSNKKELWKLRDYLKAMLAELGLEIKPSEAVRPLKVGIDYLGYNTFVDDSKAERVVYSRIRKRTKQKFARRIKRVKSRKRRQSLIGSFFGMAAHADCRHLLKTLITPQEFKKLKHKRKMKQFGNFKVRKLSFDGKKNFKGNRISGRELDHKGIIVYDFERDMIPKREREEYQRRCQSASAQGIDISLVEKPKTKYLIQLIYNGELRKMWTGDQELWQILEEIDAERGFPFFAGITVDYSGQYPKTNFVDASAINVTPPSDEEIARIFTTLNLNPTPYE